MLCSPLEQRIYWISKNYNHTKCQWNAPIHRNFGGNLINMSFCLLETFLFVYHCPQIHMLFLCCRPRAAGLFIGIECSRVRDRPWMYLTSFVTTRIGVELAAVQRKLPDCVVVGLQLYSARTFHITLSPRIYKGGQGPPPNNYQHLRQYKPPHRT